MKSLLVAVTIGVASATLGCANRIKEEFVSVECVVQEIDPYSRVFYDLKTSKVRITFPAELAGRIYEIDFTSADEKEAERFERLRHLGAKVRFSIPAAMIPTEDRILIPIHVLKKEPNQALEPTTTSVTPRADARVAPAVVVAHL